MRGTIFSFLVLFTLSVLLISCSPKPETNIVDVTAKDFSFIVKDSIPSGWTTFRFKNEGHAHHFFFLTLMPDNKTLNNYTSELGPAFGITWDSLKAGMNKNDAGLLLGSLIPKWYAKAKVMGGAGLIAPGKTTETTVKLEPGYYVMECYVKTPDGVFHSALGMIRSLIVTNEVSKMHEPENSDIDLTLSNYKIESKGNLTVGDHVVAVHFKEHPKFGLGNDVHVVRITDNTNMDDVINWMDWMNINGLRTPAPAEFIGGTQEMPVGYTSYFKLNLSPGKYAFISESAADKGMVKEFTVD